MRIRTAGWLKPTSGLATRRLFEAARSAHYCRSLASPTFAFGQARPTHPFCARYGRYSPATNIPIPVLGLVGSCDGEGPQVVAPHTSTRLVGSLCSPRRPRARQGLLPDAGAWALIVYSWPPMADVEMKLTGASAAKTNSVKNMMPESGYKMGRPATQLAMHPRLCERTCRPLRRENEGVLGPTSVSSAAAPVIPRLWGLYELSGMHQTFRMKHCLPVRASPPRTPIPATRNKSSQRAPPLWRAPGYLRRSNASRSADGERRAVVPCVVIPYPLRSEMPGFGIEAVDRVEPHRRAHAIAMGRVDNI